MTTRVRAIIIKNNKILLLKRKKDNIVYWVLPGGQVEPGEINELALARECQEELGVQVKIKELIHEMLSKKPELYGQREYFFNCEIIGGTLGSGVGPEWQPSSGYQGTYQIEWLDFNNLSKIDLKPEEIKSVILSHFFGVKRAI
jgi:8-oxo-dGTP pyrophosphatase MutT (NUDIX family)